MVNRTLKLIQIPLPIEGATIEIPLTKGYVTVVDAVDADLLQVNWCINGNSSQGYDLYATRRPTANTKIYMHRLIVERAIGRPLESHEHVDHANLNRLDNRRSNLRIATRSQNLANMRKKEGTKSGYKGVYKFQKRRGTKIWCAEITVNNKKIRLGYFYTAEDAYKAYCDAAVKYHGEFARLD